LSPELSRIWLDVKKKFSTGLMELRMQLALLILISKLSPWVSFIQTIFAIVTSKVKWPRWNQLNHHTLVLLNNSIGNKKMTKHSWICQNPNNYHKYSFDCSLMIIKCFCQESQMSVMKMSKNRALNYLGLVKEAKFQQMKSTLALKVIMLGKYSMKELDLKTTIQFKDLWFSLRALKMNLVTL